MVLISCEIVALCYPLPPHAHTLEFYKDIPLLFCNILSITDAHILLSDMYRMLNANLFVMCAELSLCIVQMVSMLLLVHLMEHCLCGRLRLEYTKASKSKSKLHSTDS